MTEGGHQTLHAWADPPQRIEIEFEDPTSGGRTPLPAANDGATFALAAGELIRQRLERSGAAALRTEWFRL